MHDKIDIPIQNAEQNVYEKRNKDAQESRRVKKGKGGGKMAKSN